MSKRLVIIFLAVINIFCINLKANQAFAQEMIASNSKEKKVLSLVAALPEVQKRARQIKVTSGGKAKISLIISATPDIYIPYYQVNVNDGAPSFNNYYQFAVDPKTFQIFFYDAAKNKQYSLDEWRKMASKN